MLLAVACSFGNRFPAAAAEDRQLIQRTFLMNEGRTALTSLLDSIKKPFIFFREFEGEDGYRRPGTRPDTMQAARLC